LEALCEAGEVVSATNHKANKQSHEASPYSPADENPVLKSFSNSNQDADETFEDAPTDQMAHPIAVFSS